MANGGPSQAKNVTVTDVLPAGLIFQPSVGCTAVGQTVTCGPLATLDVGRSQVFKVTVQLDPAYAGDGSDIKNQALVKSDPADPNMANNTSDASTGGLPGPGPGPNPPLKPSADLSIAKKAEGTAAVAAGQSFVYDIAVANAGPSQAKNVTVTDALPAGLIFQPSAGCTAAGQTVTCGPLATVNVGETKTIRITVQLDPAYAGDGSDLVNSVVVSARNADPNETNNTDSVTGLPDPDCTDPKASPAAPGCPGKPGRPKSTLVVGTGNQHDEKYPGEIRQLAFDVTNLGPSTLRDPAVLTIEIPGHLHRPNEQLPPECTANPGNTQLTCQVPAGLKPQGAARVRAVVDNGSRYTTGELRFPVDPLALGGETVTGTEKVSYTRPEGPAQATGTWTTYIKPRQAGLVVTKTAVPPANGGPVSESNPFDYLVAVTSKGPSAARNVFVTDPLPKALVFAGSATGCRATGQTVTCPVHDPLLNGATVTERISVKLSPSYRGDGSDIFNTATAHSDTPNPLPGTNPAGTGGLNGIRVTTATPLPNTGAGGLLSELGWATMLAVMGAGTYVATRRRRR